MEDPGAGDRSRETESQDLVVKEGTIDYGGCEEKQIAGNRDR